MTASLIRQLIDICTIPDPEIVPGPIDALLREELVRNGSHGYQVTARGQKMFELLTEVPLPIQIWSDPRKAK